MAGSDTTATAMRATMLHLLMNPRVVAKMRAEVARHAVSIPITDAEARRLPYLQAIIKEGLRICRFRPSSSRPTRGTTAPRAGSWRPHPHPKSTARSGLMRAKSLRS